MAGLIFPYTRFQAMDENGNPMVGAKLFTYEEGTSTKKTTYSDKALSAANTNPVVLDSRGEAAVWGTGSYKFVLAPSNDTDPPTSPIWTEDGVALDATLSITPSGGNLVVNPSFEEDEEGDGVPDGWTVVEATDHAVNIDAADSAHGAKSLEITSNAGATNETTVTSTAFIEVGGPNVNTTAGTDGYKYAVQHMLKCNLATADVKVRVHWYDRTQAFVSTTTAYSNSTTNPTSWATLVSMVEAPATAAYAKVELSVTGIASALVVNFDSIRLVDVAWSSVDAQIGGNWQFEAPVVMQDTIDLQGAVSNSTGNVTISDAVDVTGTLTVTGSADVTGTISVGTSGGGDAIIYFHDDNTNTERSLWWSDTNNDWYVEDNGGTGRKVWHQGNDGSGSGLDADTVDGIQGASLLRSDTSDSFTSGTLTTSAGTTVDINGGMTIGDPTGGSQGNDTINSENGYYTNGNKIGATCRVRRTSDQTVSNNTFTNISWQSELVDDFSGWTVGSASRITVPTGATRVLIQGQLSWDTATGTKQVRLYKNGATMSPEVRMSNGQATNSAGYDLTFAVVLDVTGGDYFEMNARQLTGSNLNMDYERSWFAMTILG